MLYQTEVALETKTQFELIDLTAVLEKAVRKSRIKTGSVLIFSPHTTAAIRINHNEPLLKQDLMKCLYHIAPLDINYAHDFFEIRTKVKAEERSNGHAHVKAFLLSSSETVPLTDGEMLLGEKQSVFFVELDGGRERRVIIQVSGE